MVQLHAQPYDIEATGFYFNDAEAFRRLASSLRNRYGQPVEEFEIQFIDGDALECALAEAWGLNQVNFSGFFDAVDNWDEERQRKFVLAVGECGYDAEELIEDEYAVDVDIYHIESLRELAEQFVDEGYFGEIPERLAFYIDYDAIARDLAHDYSTYSFGGDQVVYRCG